MISLSHNSVKFRAYSRILLSRLLVNHGFLNNDVMYREKQDGGRRGVKVGINYFADLRLTFRQNFFLQNWFRNEFGVGLG